MAEKNTPHSNDERHAQVMGALDLLAQRLIKSELERSELKEVIRDTIADTEDVRTLLEKSEISRLRQQQGMLSMLEEALNEQETLKEKLETSFDASDVPDLSEFKTSQEKIKALIVRNHKEMKEIREKQKNHDAIGIKADFVEEQMKRLHDAVQDVSAKAADTEKLDIEIKNVESAQQDIKKVLEESDVRQAALSEELKVSKQKQTVMERRIEASIKRYQRLERKFHRVERIALETQEALQAKAMVLLTDQGAIQISDQMDVLAAPTQSKQKPAREQDNIIDFVKRHARSAVSVLVISGVAALLLYGVSQVKFDSVLPDDIQKVEITKNETLKPLATDDPVFEYADSFFEDSDPIETEPQAAFLEEDPRLKGSAQVLQIRAIEGQVEAQHDLATLYASGQGDVEIDYERAAYWFEKAALNGNENAGYNLGVLYHQGLGVPESIDEAVYWYQQAAEKDHAEAHYNLGIASIEGIGVEFDASKAASHFELAARKEIPEAAYNLGLILENGLLGAPDLDQALYWYKKAATAGNQQAQEAYDQLNDVANALQRDTPKDEQDTPVGEQSSLESDKGEKVDLAAAAIEEEEEIIVPERVQETDENTEVFVAGAILADESFDGKNEAVSQGDQLVADTQKHLKKINLYKGDETGVMDNITRDAVMAYQALYELPVTGDVDSELLDHMSYHLASADIAN